MKDIYYSRYRKYCDKCWSRQTAALSFEDWLIEQFVSKQANIILDLEDQLNIALDLCEDALKEITELKTKLTDLIHEGEK